MHEIEHGETLRKIASAGGIFSNISPPTTLKKSFFRISATTCGRSNTMHLNPGKASAMILTEVPVPPPTSTRLCKPSNICGVHVPVSVNTSLRRPQLLRNSAFVVPCTKAPMLEPLIRMSSETGVRR